jgi:hypothetical protein
VRVYQFRHTGIRRHLYPKAGASGKKKIRAWRWASVWCPPEGPESGLDRLDSVSVRVDNLVKDRRPPEAAALRAVLDKIVNTNNWQPSDQGRQPDQC